MSNPRNSMNSPEPVGPSLPRDAAAEQKNTAPDPAPSPPETLPAPCEADLLAKVLAGDHLAFAQALSLGAAFELQGRVGQLRTEALVAHLRAETEGGLEGRIEVALAGHVCP